MTTVRKELIRQYQTITHTLIVNSAELVALIEPMSDGDVPDERLEPLELLMDALQIRLDELNSTFNADFTNAELEAHLKTAAELAKDFESFVQHVREVLGGEPNTPFQPPSDVGVRRRKE